MLLGLLALAERGRGYNIGFVKDTFFGGAEKRAGEKQAEAARASARLTAEQFQEVKGLALPFVKPGAPALRQQASLSGALGPGRQAQAFRQFQEDPGTQFLREQGLRLIGSGAAATGQLGGGERLRELTRFSQGLALQDLSARFGRLGEVARTGIAGVGTIAGAGAAAAGIQSQALQAAGQAQAEGITGQAAGIRTGIQGLGALLSDVRLKKNIERIGTLDSGLGWYRWEWTEQGASIAGDQSCQGVLAHEAREVFPDAVIEIDNYLRVDYARIH